MNVTCITNCVSLKIYVQDWKDGSVVKRTGCSSEVLSSIPSNHMDYTDTVL
ncbi:hypothetical protein I79_025508 [Cricetulus griseus]|uniref:Uncharacterized protein n=1 Tax=Cricetulus griseus TaxID=10029 RepID=G3INI3_CRIGR|nr:hypothetical protein I79_025508 [Cricetulus griseus]